MVVCENEEHLVKYLKYIHKLPRIRKIILYADDVSKLKEKYKEHSGLLMGWEEFLNSSN